MGCSVGGSQRESPVCLCKQTAGTHSMTGRRPHANTVLDTTKEGGRGSREGRQRSSTEDLRGGKGVLAQGPDAPARGASGGTEARQDRACQGRSDRMLASAECDTQPGAAWARRGGPAGWGHPPPPLGSLVFGLGADGGGEALPPV